MDGGCIGISKCGSRIVPVSPSRLVVLSAATMVFLHWGELGLRGSRLSMEGARGRCGGCTERFAPNHLGGAPPQVVTRRAAWRGGVEAELAVMIGVTVRACGGCLGAGAAIMPSAAAAQARVSMSLLVASRRWRAAASATNSVTTAPTALSYAAGCSGKLRSPPSCESMGARLRASRYLGFDLRHVVCNVVVEARVGGAPHELAECGIGLREAVIEHRDKQAVVDGSPSSALDVRMRDHHLVVLQSEIVFTEVSARVDVR